MEKDRIGRSLQLHVLVYLTAFGLQIALARWATDKAAFGNYAFHLSLAQSLAILAGLGVPTAALRFISRHLAHRQGEQARQLAKRAYKVASLGWITAAAGLVGVAFLMQGAVSVGLISASMMIPLFGLRFMNESMAKTQHRPGLTLLPGGVIQPLFMLGACALISGLQANSLEASQLLLVATAALCICSIGQLIWLARSKIRYPSSDRMPASDEPPHTFTTREMLRVALPMLLVSGLGIAMSQCDIIMLRLLKGDAATGEYFVAVRLSWITVLPLISVNLFAAATYAGLWELKAIEEMRIKAQQYSRFIFYGTIPIVLVLIAAGNIILSWHGSAYLAAYTPLVILVVGQCVNASVGSTGLLLSMTGHQDIVAKIFAPCAILNVIANACLIPPFGPTGAAIATALSLAIWNLSLIWVIWRKLKLDTSWWILWPGRMNHFNGQVPKY
jgi:O-antigen/teichoic acid export membrane protein